MEDSEMEESQWNEEQVETFGEYCKSFYQSSFGLSAQQIVASTSSSSSSSSVNETNNTEASKVMLEALDFYLQYDATTIEMTWTNNQQLFSTDKIERFADDLKSCGFLQHDDEDGQTKFPIIISSDVLLKYTQVRDDQRRNVHLEQMSLRMKRLETILLTLPQISSQTTSDNIPKSEEDEDGKAHPLVTRNSHIKHIRSITSLYMEKYKNNMGCHSFIAGLRSLIEKQLSAEVRNKMVQWTFRGSVLTECVINGKVAQEEYLKDSLELLLSFLIRIPTPNDDLEKGENGETKSSVDDNDCYLSFEVDPYISNARLRAVIDKFPSKNNLDVRPTGKYNIGVNDDIRKNVSGGEDEPGFMLYMVNWSDSFCTVL